MSITAYSSARIGEIKIFYELDVHHVQKVGIKGFLAQEVKMSLTANQLSRNQREEYFSLNSTYIMPRKQESNVFGLTRPK